MYGLASTEEQKTGTGQAAPLRTEQSIPITHGRLVQGREAQVQFTNLKQELFVLLVGYLCQLTLRKDGALSGKRQALGSVSPWMARSISTPWETGDS